MKVTRTDTETESRLLIEGSLDAATAAEARPVFDAIVTGAGSNGKKGVVVDLQPLTMLDSSGIGLLVALSKRLREAGRAFHVINAHEQPLMVIKLLKLETLFGI